ncbi:MAG TPA: ribonuclease R [Caulobacteraceae bacterium]|nr:ribonuclease R [Caulobacteraceae bacterium]
MKRPPRGGDRRTRTPPRGRRRREAELPPVGVVDVAERDADGDLFVRLVKDGGDRPPIRLAPSREEQAAGAPGLGDRLLVRFERTEGGEIEARLIKRLGQSAHRILGVVRKARGEVRIEPVDRRSKESLVVLPGEARDLADGDLVLAQVDPSRTRSYGPKSGRVVETVGREDDPRAASLLAIHTHGVPTGFSDAAEDEARAARLPGPKGRTDLTRLPLITIDPADARDHDDAVYAEPDEDPRNPGGWIVWVAIADVAAAVTPGSALDQEARTKGNSVYFPDRVEPMLPEALSADLCSLKVGELRGCLAARMVFAADGTRRAHRFERGLMRSAASLSYEQAQAAIDGAPDAETATLMENVLGPLWSAYRALAQARTRRSPLEITSAERRIVLGADGKVASIMPRASLEAHRLIEEFMIQANVCAAETLERRRTPLIYRVHDAPSADKMDSLADFLESVGIAWSKGEPPRTDRFNRLLAQSREGSSGEIVNEVVLRTQMQAIYSPENIGHFGLNLDRYAHFTSPIRRYADLVVHRGLIRALGLGVDGMTDADVRGIGETAEHITMTERRAMAAERDATDRYVAAFLADRVGADFAGRITGVTRFGLFVRLTETGADGFVPISTLGDEYFVHDERAHALVGQDTGARWRLGRPVDVRLREATPITGGLLLEMLGEPEPGDEPAPRRRPSSRGRNANRRRGR